MAWILVSSVVAAGALVAVFLNRPGQSTGTSPPAASVSIPPPPVTELVSATAEPPPAPADVPPAAESVAAATVTAPVPDPSTHTAPPRGVPSMQVTPRPMRPTGGPSAVGSTPAKADDDIPALR